MKKDRVILFHNCKVMKCKVLKDNREPCQFCGRKKWKVYERVKKEEPLQVEDI